MLTAIDCAFVEKQDLVALYLGGKLSEFDSQLFEAHYFGCDRCWGELRRASSIRAAFGRPAAEASHGTVATRGRERLFADTLAVLAAAAAVVIVAIGIHQLAEGPQAVPSESTYRGALGSRITVEVSAAPNHGVVLSWAPIDEARTYVLRVFASDGVPILNRELEETRVLLEPDVLRPARPGVSFLARIEAVNSLGQVVAASEPARMPLP